MHDVASTIAIALLVFCSPVSVFMGYVFLHVPIKSMPASQAAA
jgi:hypothetical protein